jgi:hypothetical protein
MQNPQQVGNQFAQVNVDAAVRMSAQAAEFWRRYASLQAAGMNQIVQEGVRMTRAILHTQAEIVEAAGQCLSENNRAVFQAVEEGSQQAGETARQSGSALQQSSQQGSSQPGQRKAA